MDNHGNEFSANAGPLHVRGKGSQVVNVILATALGILIWLGFMKMGDQHMAIVGALNDVFLASMLSEQQKRELPVVLQEKINTKTLEKAERAAKKPTLKDVLP